MTDFRNSPENMWRVIAVALLAMTALAGCSGQKKSVISETARSAAQENSRGLLASSRGDWDSALDEFHSALKLNGTIENTDGMALNLLNMARLHRHRSELGKAGDEIDRALALVANSSPLYSELAFERARISQKAGDLPAAATWAKKALERATDAERGSRLNLLGRILFQQTMMREAEELTLQALTTNRQNGLGEEEANSQRLLGDIYCTAGNFPAAMEAYERALALDKELGRSGKITLDLMALGSSAALAEMDENALGYYLRALDVARYAEDRGAASELMMRIARLYEKRGDGEKARTWHAERERLLTGTAQK